ncbi:unnamed protein product [Aphanomyces euteiches]|uniref:JmjC domain-containing protein n=1 Tax=Aphanomyces euteiches TaxID=100861 RepID=A0A6G0XUZ2_9STRA|nr:hypothetical protein Ae201684_000758 [Aphanomyces euteiches]KAH9156324.1 hypothetical protein AeRB84_001755 [Aphanomyces euteiches]
MVVMASLTDHLKAYLTLFLDAEDLQATSQVSKVWFIFCNEEPLWMLQVLRKHQGQFTYRHSWKYVFYHPREDVPFPSRPCISMPPTAFTSDFLYRRYCRCHMDVSNFTPDKSTVSQLIPRFSIDDVTPTSFFSQFARRPVVLTNAMTTWPAFAHDSPRGWTLPHLVTRYGDVSCRVTHNLDVSKEEPTLRMTLADFATYTASQHDETPLYIFDADFGTAMPELLDDYSIPSVFQEDLLSLLPTASRPDFRWIVIGPARSGASWHVDPVKTSAWNALVVGRKRWALYPPGRQPPGITLLEEDIASPSITTLDWYLHVYPTLADEDKPMEIIQEPGDVISVPSGWWHAVLNLEMTVAVTQNFVDAHNVSDFIESLIRDGDLHQLEPIEAAVKKANLPVLPRLFQLHQMPSDEGCTDEAAMVEFAFSDAKRWEPRIRHVVDSTPQMSDWLSQHTREKPWTAARTIESLTSRVNPTFSVHGLWAFKFFSPLNRLWGTCSEAAVLTTTFPKRGNVQAATVASFHEFLVESYETECLVYDALAKANVELAPTLVASGYLRGDSTWRWPYIVTSFNPQLVSLDQVLKTQGGLKLESWHALVDWLGSKWFPAFHALEVPKDRLGLFQTPISSLQWYIEYLQRRRDGLFATHAQDNEMPRHLLAQLDAYLPTDANALVDSQATRVVFVHQDLTDENILGRISDLDSFLDQLDDDKDKKTLREFCKAHGIGTANDLVECEPWDQTGTSHAVRWKLFKLSQAKKTLTTSFALKEDQTTDKNADKVYQGSITWTPEVVIDFADTKTGDPLWDLVPVLFSTLHGDVDLCRRLLQTSYWRNQIDAATFPQRMMQLTLLHPSQCIRALFHYFPQTTSLPTWEQVADLVFSPMVAKLDDIKTAAKAP